MSYTFAVNLLTQDDVTRVTRALVDAGVTNRYALPNHYAARPPSPSSSDPLAASWIHVSKPTATPPRTGDTSFVSIDQVDSPTPVFDAFPSDNPYIHYGSGYRFFPTLRTTFLTVEQFIMLIKSFTIIQESFHS